MSNDLKYDSSYSDDFDFVQEGEEIRELTVEITLAEYRQLIQENIQQSLEIEELKQEIEGLRNRTRKTKKKTVNEGET